MGLQSPQSATNSGHLSIVDGFDFFRSTQSALCNGVRSILSEDALISDVFRINPSTNEIAVRPESKILSGHFPGMPLVPGVMLKRLIRKTSWTDLYHHWTSSDPACWKTEFVSPVTLGSKNLSLVMTVRDGIVLKAGNQMLVHSDQMSNRSKKKGPQTLPPAWNNYRHVTISQLPTGDVSRNLLQDGTFRFATAGWAIFEVSQKLLGGYFDVPKDFSFVEGADKHVPIEILEESVAQILSLAYARARELPPIRTNGSVEEKAKILTFKSSVAESGGSHVFQWDRLSVVFELIEETDRSFTVSYGAWNMLWEEVLSGEIEASVIPFRLLRRLVG